MKTIYLLLVIVTLSACTSPQVTVTSEVTVTSTPPPTETPMPTATPVAVDGVADVDGTLYIFDEKMQAWVALPALEEPYAKVVVDENNEIVALGTDGAEMYTLDMGTGNWLEAVTFEPMELMTDPNKMGVCTYEDITSGRLDWNVDQAIKNGDIVFPEDAHNGGWENKRGENSLGNIYFSEDSKDAMQLVNLCKINGKFLGFPNDTSYVASVAVLNVDGTVGTLHFFINERPGLDWFLKLDTGNLGITKSMPAEQAEKFWDDPKYGPISRLYPTLGEKELMRILNELQISGMVSEELSKTLVIPSKK